MIRREGDRTGVIVVEGERAAWRPVKVGTASVTRVQVISGVSEGEQVALPVDVPVRNGDVVRPVARS